MADDGAALSALDGHYELHFAGRPRATRDVAMLDAMLQTLATAAPGAEQQSRQAAWGAERRAIVEAQTVLGEEGLAAARALERLALVAARVTRAAVLCPADDFTDAEARALLDDVVEAHGEAMGLRLPGPAGSRLAPEQKRVQAALASARQHVEAWRDASAAALSSASLSASDNAPGRVVARAQRLLARYAAEITGRLQPAVRPGLLAALAAGLAEIADSLAPHAPAGVDAAAHAANCRALVEQSEHWRAQRLEVEKVRRQRAAAELVALLLEEADHILAAMDEGPAAGEEGALRLAWLGERMDELYRQLDALPTAFGLGNHAQATLGIIDCVQFLDARLAAARS